MTTTTKIKGNENKRYQYIKAFGQVSCSEAWYIEQEQWRAFHQNAPLETVRFKDGKPVLFSDLDENWRKAVNEFIV